uniref:Uncharacterized protein n=1 Tax=Strombidium inclinatum TaxID=197538 RepID=A0A7S3MVT1_9SPIT
MRELLGLLLVGGAVEVVGGSCELLSILVGVAIVVRAGLLLLRQQLLRTLNLGGTVDRVILGLGKLRLLEVRVGLAGHAVGARAEPLLHFSIGIDLRRILHLVDVLLLLPVLLLALASLAVLAGRMRV